MKKLLTLALTLMTFSIFLTSCEEIESHVFNDLPVGKVIRIRQTNVDDPNDNDYNLRRITIKTSTSMEEYYVSYSYVYNVSYGDSIIHSKKYSTPPIQEYSEEVSNGITRPKKIELTVTKNKPVSLD